MRAALAVGCGLALTACAPGWKRAPHDQVFQRAAAPKPHRMPAVEPDASSWWNYVQHAFVLPLANSVNPARYARSLFGARPALDVNAFGQVPDSTWFENRIGKRALTAAELRRGPNLNPGPARGALTVISGKLRGATTGLVVRDRNNVVWFVKFDPPAHPDMSSGAEVIASRILWAAGYHVPETHVGFVTMKNLVLGPNAHRRDRYHRLRRLRQRDLRLLITQLNPDMRGRVRAMFSRALPGRIVGPTRFRGTRPDDPNDRIAHERRRSLRGLGVFSAWINNTGAHGLNTLDTFIGGATGYVRHYLIDFNSALGAAGTREKFVGESYAYQVDWAEIAQRMIALGFHYPYWLKIKRSPYRSVGIFEAKLFDPARWKPTFPNPAFDRMTPRDRFWAAGIIARFNPALVGAAVAAAEYRERGAADAVTAILLERRRKILEHAWSRMEPLDLPRMRGRYVLRLDDLRQVAGLARAPARFVWRVSWNRTVLAAREIAGGVVRTPQFDLRLPLRKLMLADKDAFVADPFLTLSIWRLRGTRRGPRVDVHLRAAYDRLIPVGLDREVR